MDVKKSSHEKSSKEKVCFNCLTKETPLWRRSKKGANLCNACGLYYRNHGEHRPMLKSNNYQNQMLLNQKETDISALEEIAINVLSEMRGKVRAFRNVQNQNFNYKSHPKSSKEFSPKKIRMHSASTSAFDLKSLQEKFRGASMLYNDDPLKPFRNSEEENNYSLNCIDGKGKNNKSSKSGDVFGNDYIDEDESCTFGGFTSHRDYSMPRNPGLDRGLEKNSNSYGDRHKEQLNSSPTFTIDSTHMKTNGGVVEYYKANDHDSEELQDVINKLATLSDQ